MEYPIDDYLALWWHGEMRLPEPDLIAWARRQRLLPLLGWRADTEGWQFPEAITGAIRRSRLAVAASQTVANLQLTTLGDIAQRLSIPVVLVKGAAAAEAYPEPWMRPYGDIDLLVSSSDASRLLIGLRAHGYTEAHGLPGTRHEHLPPMAPADGGRWVEIHTSLAWVQNRALFALGSWVDRLHDSRRYPGLSVPDPADHVLYLVFHGIVQHSLQRSIQVLADLRFCSSSWVDHDWGRLHDLAKTSGLTHALGLAVALGIWFWNGDWGISKSTALRAPPASVLATAQNAVMWPEADADLPQVWRRFPDSNVVELLRYARTMLTGDPAETQGMSTKRRLVLGAQRPVYLLRTYTGAIWRLLKGEPGIRSAWRAQRDLQNWLREG
jgi:hypothetical protein